MKNIRKGSAVLLTLLVIFFTVVSILAIWEVIDIQEIFRKSITTLFIIFVAAAVILFLFAVVFKDNNEEKRPPRPPHQPLV